MKKVAAGICAILLMGSAVASLKGGVLKADELEPTLESSTGLSVNIGSSSESVETVVEENKTPEAPVQTPESSTVTETPPVESSEVAESSEAPIVESSSSSIEESVESSTSDSTRESTEPTSSETSESSTSTDTSSTKPSTSESSGEKEPETSDSTTTETSSTNESQAEETVPAESSEPPAPTPVAPVTPVATPEISTPSPTWAPASNPTFSEAALSNTSTLNLPSEFKAERLAESDLGLFELPLLSSFKRQEEAALIYGGIKHVGKAQADELTAEAFFNQLYTELFGAGITENNQKTEEDELTAGMLLYQKDVLVGMYLGNNSYLTIADVEIEEEATNEESEETEEVGEAEPAESETEKPKERQAVVRLVSELEEDIYAQGLPEVTLTEYGQSVVAEYPASKDFQANEGTQKFIDSLSEDARTLGLEYDVFASVMLAQAILESGSGSSGLSVAPYHNLFGVKGTYQGQSVSFATNEDRGNGELYQIQSAFRRYPNYAASLGDYVTLLRGGISGNDAFYQNTWRSKAKNYLNATYSLTGSYATDTEYFQKLNSLIAVYHLTEYDRPKANDSSVFIKGKEEIPVGYKERMKFPDYDGKNYNSSGSYPVGQCTWYAFNRVKQLGKSVDDYMGNGGEWGINGKRLGYEVSHQPKAGWLVSFTPGSAGSDARYGHVAFVEAVGPEGILISEGNVYGGTIISYRVIGNDLAQSNLVSYIKPK
ncbi:glucosaminidase domain-containing protein [Enterococcus sp. 669A]|uniref:Glucosaminidase domain-containing protein n=1 Tax=Candidatus Enterococcus moelleringii TaxID=2815325 RepID=A0ABS3L917_9ENTE|nr:glucosaminidase domain-containing protein [Enterococcus sp. 669A]MBO1306128.1 glucosaminidase domain-containing protein [Enterococcus sp. 669A]